VIAQAKQAIVKGLERAGYGLVPYDPLEPPLRARADLLAARGIDAVLDVGANEGQYVADLRRAGWSGPVASFEPLLAAYTKLERAVAADPAWTCRRLALADAAGERELHVAGNTASSSLLPMTELHRSGAPESGIVGTERVPTARLADVLDEVAPGASRIWLKLDVQGGELAVLEGAEAILDRVQVIESELSLDTLYAGQPDLMQVSRWLGERGFLLTRLDEGFVHRTTGQLLQCDGLFVRAGSALLESRG
jgi:FkbM family methyltransferase